MKLNWVKVLLFYIGMFGGGIICWIIPIMSFKGWWIGGLVGVIMATLTLMGLIGPFLYQKIKDKYAKHKNSGGGDLPV